ncbi:DUF1327 domain-containing protein [Escherichia coli]
MFSHPVYLFLRKFSLQDFRGGSIFDLDVAMDRVEGAALEFYEAAARRSVRQVFLEVAEKLSEKVESYLQHQYSFKIENPANKHERPHHKYL